MEKLFSKWFIEVRIKKEQFSTYIGGTIIPLCSWAKWLGYDTQNYTGKVMGEVYFPAWFHSAA